MKIAVAQESFAAGEISPLTYSRYSAEGYASGAKTMLNMHPDSRGPALGRLGTKYFDEVSSKTAGRSFNFRVDDTSYYTMVVTDLDVDCYKNDGSTPQNLTSPYTAAQLAEVQGVITPDGLTIYLFHPNVSVRKIVYTPGSDTFAISTVSFTAAPAEWTGTNYPAAGAYYQGRLICAATPDEPTTIWASKSALPEDFTSGSLDADGFSVVLAKAGRIRWLFGTKNLLVGTVNAEHIITSEAGVITPTDHEVTQQSAYGSASIQVEQVGDQVFYVSPDGTKLRALQYEWTKDNWLSTDLTYFSEHITAAKIIQIVWQQNPNNRFWCVLDDGTLAELAYDRSNNIYGWAQHDFGGTVVDVSVGSNDGVDELNVLVDRNGSDLYLEIEVIGGDGYDMDSWAEKNGSAFTDFDGLDHLEGEEIQIIADGGVVASKTVSSGSVTLDVAADHAVGGLQFIPTLVILPLEKGSNIGPSPPMWKNYYRIDVHLYNSAHPLINGVRVPTRNPATLMDEPEALSNGKSFVRPKAWGNETDITITQDLPLPLNVTAVSGMVVQEVL